MRRKLAVVGFGVLAAMAPVSAHHAFSAEFDANRPVKFQANRDEGGVDQPALVDPRRREAAGRHVQRWMIEGGTPNTLLRRGFTRDSLKAGMVIVVDGYQAKDGTQRANGRDLTFPDGRKLFLGSSGTGAPTDGDGRQVSPLVM